MTNPDNVGGLVWYVCTSCMLMVQLPSDTPTLGRCQCSPKGWSLRRAKLPKGYELCRATPAGGDDLYRQACDSVEEWKARALEAEADIARIHAQINAENGPTFMGEPVVSAPAVGRPYGGDPAEPRDDSDRYDSAPAGGDSLRALVKELRESLEGVVRVADRKTDEFDRAREAIARASHVFVNAGDSEAQFIADGENLDCPTCGGSGHAGDSAPAGSGEVEALASRLVSMSNGLHSAHLCTDLRRAAALLRKLQQGAE